MVVAIENKHKFVYDTSPVGGISFKDEYYNRTGTTFEACLQVYDAPNIFGDMWITTITNIDDSIVTVDYFTDEHTDYKTAVKDSLSEQVNNRVKNAQGVEELDEIDDEISALRNLSSKMKDGEKIKICKIRIYLSESTHEKLQEKVANVKKELATEGFLTTVYLDENKEEWQSQFLGADAQEKLPNNKVGIELPAEAVAIGFAYDQTSLYDPSGVYFGSTRTGGSFYWDLFHKTKTRLYYNLFIAGDMGSGKSTFIKKEVKTEAKKNNFIRGFDKSTEYFKQTKHLGGITVKLDGSEGMINMFQVYPTITKKTPGIDLEDDMRVETDEVGSFSQNQAKLNINYRQLRKNKVSEEEMTDFDLSIFDFYCDKGIWGEEREKDITSLSEDEYPTLGEYLTFIFNRKEIETDPSTKDNLNIIYKTMLNLQRQYGHIFDGHTTFPDLMNEQIVFYDISSLSQFSEQIFDIQIYNTLTIIWADMMKNGQKEKAKFDSNTANWDELTRFVVILDEVHNYLNLKKAYAADFFVTFMSEARKFLAGTIMGIQRIERMFPKANNVSDPEMVVAANKLSEVFGLTQYKAVFKQDTSSMEHIRNVFGKSLTENEYEILPFLEVGQCVFSIAGDKNYVVQMEATDTELAQFDGGA